MEKLLKYDIPSTTRTVAFQLGDRVFRCLPDCPPEYWARLCTADALQTVRVAIDFIEAVIADDADREAFHGLMESRDVIIPAELVVQIAVDLLAEYAGRPTNGSAG